MTTTNTARPITTTRQAASFRRAVFATRETKGLGAALTMIDDHALATLNHAGLALTWAAPLRTAASDSRTGYAIEAATEAALDRAIAWFVSHGYDADCKGYDADCGWSATVTR